MKFTLDITMKNTEGVLERILGKLRQRNLNIQTINASCTKDLTNIEAKITVEGKASAEPMIKQLNKLYDIQTINVFSYPDIKEEASQTFYPSANQSIVTALGEHNEFCLSI